MEYNTDAMGMLDLMVRPAFCVKNGAVVKVNPAAAGYLIETGTDISRLLQTGAEEYADFTGGCLYLTLSLSGQSVGVSVTRMAEFDVFCLEQEADSAELQAMALAARELREPLASVMLTADRLFPVSGLTDDPQTREQVARINRGLFQMLRVIGNMSDAGRYCAESSSRQEIRDICAVIGEAFEKAAALVTYTGTTLTYEGYPEAVYCLTDSEKLERAIFNIISNALKFTPRDGTIAAKLTRRGSKLYLTVQDSGCGITENLRGNVFTRYARQPGLEDSRFGIGLGMVLIRTAAAAHGGTVLVDQPEGSGTRITMSLAIRQNATAQTRSPILAPDYAGERDHGLIELAEVLPYRLYDMP
ncbi:MAG: HAMP domain-containing histidine kinase [Oscillospiraceae bacterium]|nr:HAMP domain-containing histidine kinase [Oscillospiraceae bacterium]